MEHPDPESLRRKLKELSTSELIEALANQEQEEWLPEAYSMMEIILRERGVAVHEAIEAARQSLPDPNSPVEFVAVANVLNPLEAHLIQMRLEQAEIPVELADENLASMHYGLGIAAGGVKILVRAADAESARRLLAEPPLPVELECPSCGSSKVDHRVRLERGATVALTIFTSAPVPVVRHLYRCSACGHTWEE